MRLVQVVDITPWIAHKYLSTLPLLMRTCVVAHRLESHCASSFVQVICDTCTSTIPVFYLQGHPGDHINKYLHRLMRYKCAELGAREWSLLVREQQR